MRPDVASLQIVPPWKRQSFDSQPYPSGSQPEVLQTNWSVETKSLTLYLLLRLRASSFSGITVLHFTLEVIFLACARRQYWQTGITQFRADGNFCLMIRIVCWPNGPSNVLSRMSSWTRYMLMPSFQCHNSSSLWGDVKFLFSELPTQGNRERKLGLIG